MSESNPYSAPEPVDETVVLARSADDASLIWLAGTVATITGIGSVWFMTTYYSYGDLSSTIIYALLPTAALTIPAVAIYGAARLLFRRQFPYSSTPVSMVVAGVILAILMGAAYPFGSMALDEFFAWCISILIAVIASYAICALERMIAAKSTQSNSPNSPSAVQAGASIFWFSASCLVFGFLYGAIMQSPNVLSVLAGGAMSAVLLCLLGTASYGIATVCIARSRPATVFSRAAAALTFTITLSLLGYLMDRLDVPPGLLRLVIVLPAAVLSVVVDRLFHGRQPTPSRAEL